VKIVLLLAVLALSGCPRDEKCELILNCSEDREMLCVESTNGCGEDCHYYVFESCLEQCKPDGWSEP